MNRRFWEIENEIATHLRAILALQTERTSILSTSGDFSVPLQFDDSKRTIFWNAHSIRLGRKTYLLMKLFWNEKKHRLTIAKMEKNIWKVGSKKRLFVNRHTIKSLLRRAQKQLKDESFPYEISAVKCRSTREIKGYKLICTFRTKQ